MQREYLIIKKMHHKDRGRRKNDKTKKKARKGTRAKTRNMREREMNEEFQPSSSNLGGSSPETSTLECLQQLSDGDVMTCAAYTQRRRHCHETSILFYSGHSFVHFLLEHPSTHYYVQGRAHEQHSTSVSPNTDRSRDWRLTSHIFMPT